MKQVFFSEQATIETGGYWATIFWCTSLKVNCRGHVEQYSTWPVTPPAHIFGLSWRTFTLEHFFFRYYHFFCLHTELCNFCTAVDEHVTVRQWASFSFFRHSFFFSLYIRGHAVEQLVEALRYKSEGSGFIDIILLAALWSWGWLSL